MLRRELAHDSRLDENVRKTLNHLRQVGNPVRFPRRTTPQLGGRPAAVPAGADFVDRKKQAIRRETGPLMDFALTPKQLALRTEVREFLQHNLAPESERELEDSWIVGFSKEFSAALGARGWIGYTWPKRYGGQEGSYLERLIITEELL